MIKITTLLSLLVVLTVAHADYEYRYIEGESFNRADGAGLRNEGFASWMAHPSSGKVVVFGNPAGGFVEYDVKGLGPGQYSLFVRCLALPTTKTHLLWDGKDLGPIKHDITSTSLRWSIPVTVTGPGDHVLRLQGGEDATQWPYIDVILLTNQAGYVPPAKDADFVSFQTAWALLTVDGKPPLTLAPQPVTMPALPELRIEKLAMDSPVLGSNGLRVTVSSQTAQEIRLSACFPQLGPSFEPWTATLMLQPNVSQTATLKPIARRSGEQTLVVSLLMGEVVINGCYKVTLPSPATIALDEYAYPVGQQGGKWSADFSCSPDLLKTIRAELVATDLETSKVVFKAQEAAKERLEVIFGLQKLPISRYEMQARLVANGQTLLEDRRPFITYQPTAFPPLEPVKTSKAVGDTLLVNGKPFLGRLVYHAGASDRMREQGFNLVQCWGDNPDPVVGMMAHLDAAQKAGMYGSVALFNNPYLNKGAEFDLPHLERVVNAVKNHPAVWGWDLIDEPEPTMKPEAVQAAADLVRKLDPNHLVWVNLCRNAQITDYFASQDLWSFDYYPFPALTPFSFKTTWLNASDREVLGKKPMGAVLQTFNYNHNEIRMPTPDELRTSAWLHIIHGYKWFGYYSYSDGEPSGSLSNTPQLLSYARALNTEFARLQDVILAPGQWQPVKMEPATDKLEACEKKVGEKWYVVVVSDSKEPQQVKLTPTVAQGLRRLLIESDKPATAGTVIETTVRPFATQVWELTD